MKKILLSLCVSLMTVNTVKSELYFDKYFENSYAINNLSFSTDSLVSQVISTDQSLVIFITKKHLFFYSLRDNKYLIEQGSTEHGIQNAFREHIASYFTHGYLAFVKKKNLYIYAISKSTNEVTFREVYPADFFGIPEYTSNFTINPYNSTVVMKTGSNSAHILDFRSISKPSAEPLNLIHRNQEIKQVLIVDYGKAVAIVYKDIIDFVSLTSRAPFRSFTFNDKILSASYQFMSNTMMTFFTYKRAVSILCRNPFDRIVLHFPDPIEYRYKYPFRTGIGVLALLNKKSIEYFKVVRNIPEREIVRIPEEYKDEYEFDKNFRLSNLIQLRKEDKLKGSYEYKFVWLKGDVNGFCHPSCGEKCDAPFVPCSQFWWLLVGFAMSIVSVLIVYVSCHILYTCIEKVDFQRGRGNAYLSVIVKPKRLSKHSYSDYKSHTNLELFPGDMTDLQLSPDESLQSNFESIPPTIKADTSSIMNDERSFMSDNLNTL